MANLDEIYRRMEQERSQRAEQERRAAEQAEIRRREFVLAEQRLYESIIITAGAGASAGGGGGKGNAIPAYFTIQVTPQLDGDGLSFYIESPSAVTYDWGDGTIDDTGEHGYSTAGSYQIKISL